MVALDIEKLIGGTGMSTVIRGCVAWISIIALGSAALAGGQFQTTHSLSRSLCNTEKTRVDSIKAFCVSPNGHLYVSDGRKGQLRVITSDDSLVATLAMPFVVTALACDADGRIYVGGNGAVARVNPQGEVAATWSLPKPAEAVQSTRRVSRVATGMACTDDAVYVAMRGQTGYEVYRLTTDLADATQIVTKLRGCCGQMDIDALDGSLVIAENARHAVRVCDREGKELRRFGARDRTCKNGFGSCCGPMNVCVAGGKILTGETVSPEALIKLFDAQGKQLAVVGSLKGPSSCRRVTIGATPDLDTVYVLDGRAKPNVIRVLKKKRS